MQKNWEDFKCSKTINVNTKITGTVKSYNKEFLKITMNRFQKAFANSLHQLSNTKSK